MVMSGRVKGDRRMSCNAFGSRHDVNYVER